MGIKGFKKFYNTYEIERFKGPSCFVLIDGDIFWYYFTNFFNKSGFQDNDGLPIDKTLNPSLYADVLCCNFVKFIFEDLLIKEFQGFKPYQIILFFDNCFARKPIKWSLCIDRIKRDPSDMFNRTKMDGDVYFYMKKIDQYAKKYLRDNNYISDKAVINNIAGVDNNELDFITLTSPFSADDTIYQVVLENYENLLVPNRRAILIGPDGVEEERVLPNISIYTNDSDFIGFFNNGKIANVIQYENNNIFLVNNEINIKEIVKSIRDNNVIKKSNDYVDFIIENKLKIDSVIETEYGFLNDSELRDIYLKFKATFSPNDFISFSMFDDVLLRRLLKLLKIKNSNEAAEVSKENILSYYLILWFEKYACSKTKLKSIIQNSLRLLVVNFTEIKEHELTNLEKFKNHLNDCTSSVKDKYVDGEYAHKSDNHIDVDKKRTIFNKLTFEKDKSKNFFSINTIKSLDAFYKSRIGLFSSESFDLLSFISCNFKKVALCNDLKVIYMEDCVSSLVDVFINNYIQNSTYLIKSVEHELNSLNIASSSAKQPRKNVSSVFGKSRVKLNNNNNSETISTELSMNVAKNILTMLIFNIHTWFGDGASKITFSSDEFAFFVDSFSSQMYSYSFDEQDNSADKTVSIEHYQQELRGYVYNLVGYIEKYEMTRIVEQYIE